jgi:hypothetical protein
MVLHTSHLFQDMVKDNMLPNQGPGSLPSRMATIERFTSLNPDHAIGSNEQLSSFPFHPVSLKHSKIAKLHQDHAYHSKTKFLT